MIVEVGANRSQETYRPVSLLIVAANACPDELIVVFKWQSSDVLGKGDGVGREFSALRVERYCFKVCEARHGMEEGAELLFEIVRDKSIPKIELLVVLLYVLVGDHGERLSVGRIVALFQSFQEKRWTESRGEEALKMANPLVDVSVPDRCEELRKVEPRVCE